MSVIGSHAYMIATARDDGTRLVNAARHMGSLFAVYDTMLPYLPGNGASAAARAS